MRVQPHYYRVRQVEPCHQLGMKLSGALLGQLSSLRYALTAIMATASVILLVGHRTISMSTCFVAASQRVTCQEGPSSNLDSKALWLTELAATQTFRQFALEKGSFEP